MFGIGKLLEKRRKEQELKRWKTRITKNFKDLKVRRKLTKEQKKEVQEFYKSIIGREVDLYSHEYFYSRTGVFTKEYVPTNLYHCELLPKANNRKLSPAYGDKNMCDILFPDENQPKTILKNMNGYFYYEGKAVSREDAIRLCSNLENVVVKPTLLSEGKGIQRINIKNGVVDKTGESVAKLFDGYSKNFQIQECIQQHERMSALNPTSVNTMRILSYRSGMEILIIYSVVRIGRLGSDVDNQCAGGISTVITKDGKLGSKAFGGFSTDNVTKTDTGVILDGYQLPSYDKALAMVKRLHLRLPFFDIVGWDIAIGLDGEPVLIEFNTNPGLSQSAFCSGMGEYTERIIRELWPKKNSLFGD